MTFKLQPYQQRMLDQMNQGFKPGELILYSAGRQIDKSTISHWYDALRRNSVRYSVEASAIVDGEQWHTVRINSTDVLLWLQNQTSEHYDILQSQHSYITLVDMHEQLYLMMVLRWGHK